MWQEFEENRDRFGFSRAVAAQTGQQLGAQLMEHGLGSLARARWGPRRRSGSWWPAYEAAGVDQLIFVSQAGRNRHEHICESLELFAREVMPEFHERADDHEKAKAERLAPAVAAALARRGPAAARPGRLQLPRHAPVLTPGPRRPRRRWTTGSPGRSSRSGGAAGSARGPRGTQGPRRSVEWWR